MVSNTCTFTEVKALKLTDEEQLMLDGGQGRGVQRAMELLVALGKAFDAERMIPVARTHVALSGQEGDTYWCQLLVDGGASCKVPPTTNPSWDIKGLTKYYAVTDAELELGQRTIDVYRRIGAQLTFCCTPGLAGNVPAFGEHVAFSESSATPYVNAVLGARSNRESSCSALASAVTGVTPLYGYHFEQNRAGTMLVDIEAELKDPFDWGILGYYIGKFVGNNIPVLNFRNLKHRPRPEEMLYLGAEMATSGCAAMYHIIGVTPEAPTAAAAFKGKSPLLTLPVLQRNLTEQEEEISEKGGKINSVMLGCPHYTYDQLREVAALLRGRAVHQDVAFWVLTSFNAIELARRGGQLETIEAAGCRLIPDTCIDEPCWKSFEGGLGVTDSPKCMYYRERRGQPFVVRRLSDCIEAAVKGEV
jgi:cis-L-3-hydroxyproline dehydratase